MDKEKIENFLLYSLIITVIVAVFYMSYNYSLNVNSPKEIAIGQEYRVKDIVASNSSVMVKYYDNDKNMTEKIMVTTATNNFDVIETNNTNVSMMVLDRVVDSHINYWKIYIPKKTIDNGTKEIGRKI